LFFNRKSRKIHKMRYSSLLLLGALYIHPTTVLAWSTSSASSTDTCATITQTKGPQCPPVPGTTCSTPTCYAYATVTASCGCPLDIAVDLQCETTCGNECNTAYTTFLPPCPLSPPPTSSSSIASSSQPPLYSNTTITVTEITTITTCPATNTCTGQTLTWSGNNGPFSCSHPHASCTCVLPGGTQTVTVCPSSVTCKGQTTQWTGTEGPSSCPERVTCNLALPDVTVTSVIVTTPTIGTQGATETPKTASLVAGAVKPGNYGDGVALGLLAALLGALGML
jgi:hypothetical protein